MNLIFAALLFGVALGASATALGMTIDRRSEPEKSTKRRQKNG